MYENGKYKAIDDGADGYSKFTVSGIHPFSIHISYATTDINVSGSDVLLSGHTMAAFTHDKWACLYFAYHIRPGEFTTLDKRLFLLVSKDIEDGNVEAVVPTVDFPILPTLRNSEITGVWLRSYNNFNELGVAKRDIRLFISIIMGSYEEDPDTTWSHLYEYSISISSDSIPELSFTLQHIWKISNHSSAGGFNLKPCYLSNGQLYIPLGNFRYANPLTGELDNTNIPAPLHVEYLTDHWYKVIMGDEVTLLPGCYFIGSTSSYEQYLVCFCGDSIFDVDTYVSGRYSFTGFSMMPEDDDDWALSKHNLYLASCYIINNTICDLILLRANSAEGEFLFKQEPILPPEFLKTLTASNYSNMLIAGLNGKIYMVTPVTSSAIIQHLNVMVSERYDA